MARRNDHQGGSVQGSQQLSYPGCPGVVLLEMHFEALRRDADLMLAHGADARLWLAPLGDRALDAIQHLIQRQQLSPIPCTGNNLNILWVVAGDHEQVLTILQVLQLSGYKSLHIAHTV